MQPLVQSAIDAANQGDNNKALELCKQALAANPKDVDAWLVVAAVVDQPERKRQCLNRVLALDPTNQIARDELLEMDRAALGGTHTPPFISESDMDIPQATNPLPASASRYPASTSAFEPEPISQPTYQTEPSAFESASAPVQAVPDPSVQAKAPARPSSKTRAKKPLVFRYPLYWRIIIYFFLVVFSCAALGVASQNILDSLPVFGLAFLMGIGALAVFPKVEINESGLRASGLISSSEVNWRDIKSVKSSVMKRRLELFKANGKSVRVSTYLSGYARIEAILRQKRPDLFGMAPASFGQGNAFASGEHEQASTSGYSSSIPAPAFSGAKVFKRNLLSLLVSYIFVTLICLFAAGAAFNEPKHRIGASIAVLICMALMILGLFQVNSIKIEPNTLTIETFFEKKVFNARQIKHIQMLTAVRRGVVSHSVEITTAQGKKYSAGGFSAGEEIVYSSLTNWWNAYRNG